MVLLRDFDFELELKGERRGAWTFVSCSSEPQIDDALPELSSSSLE